MQRSSSTAIPLPIVAMWLCVFSAGTAEYVVPGVLQDIASDMKVSISTAGLVVTVYAVTVVIGGPLLTAVTVRLPRRALMFGLMSLFVVGNLLAAVATNFTVLLIARGLTALIHATFFALCIVIASTIVPADRQGRALANV